MTEATCPECGAPQREGATCEDHFHQMLFWEAEDMSLGVVHHLMVLGFHLQHPSRYSPEGLKYGMGLLDDFVRLGVTTQASRSQSRDKVDSGKRTWSVINKGIPGAYSQPITWTMTAADVVSRGMENYIASVNEWAQSIYESLNAAGQMDRPSAPQ